jgi:hypothetical protein
MAKFIRTRNSLQCRSHHQKLSEKYSHPNKIVLTFKNSFDQYLYRSYFNELIIKFQNESSENCDIIDQKSSIKISSRV